jgi:ketosteroid isomerase-like protein
MESATDTRTAAKRDAAAWVEVFTAGWSDPVDADTFTDHFEPWFAPDVRMIQPNVAPVVGIEGFREEFARPLFDLVPDLHGVVEGWASSGDTVYIELRLEGTIGRRSFEMHTCDRIKLRDGKATERFAYLDPTPLLKAMLASPRTWPKFVRIQMRSRRRARKARNQ